MQEIKVFSQRDFYGYLKIVDFVCNEVACNRQLPASDLSGCQVFQEFLSSFAWESGHRQAHAVVISSPPVFTITSIACMSGVFSLPPQHVLCWSPTAILPSSLSIVKGREFPRQPSPLALATFSLWLQRLRFTPMSICSVCLSRLYRPQASLLPLPALLKCLRLLASTYALDPNNLTFLFALCRSTPKFPTTILPIPPYSQALSDLFVLHSSAIFCASDLGEPKTTVLNPEASTLTPSLIEATFIMLYGITVIQALVICLIFLGEDRATSWTLRFANFTSTGMEWFVAALLPFSGAPVSLLFRLSYVLRCFPTSSSSSGGTSFPYYSVSFFLYRSMILWIITFPCILKSMSLVFCRR